MSETSLVTKKAWNQGWIEMNKAQKIAFVFGSILSLVGLCMVFLREDLHQQVVGSLAVSCGLYYVSISTRKDLR